MCHTTRGACEQRYHHLHENDIVHHRRLLHVERSAVVRRQPGVLLLAAEATSGCTEAYFLDGDYETADPEVSTKHSLPEWCKGDANLYGGVVINAGPEAVEFSVNPTRNASTGGPRSH